ncbi:flagellar basal body-associated protein FliL [Nocardia transvalensis]|uniref:Flagellar basal body-associated protein FliL n=1 Tax=Nocardia transvalensis TaxID=37333 RepID=A0A7W9P9X9_9NOCA|nr:DUF4129 domain-containing protein [Nocardia transvalensis]MBB5912219.1 flagellar basal body-associated protein FliL [Nocardia transvalensis]
MAADRARALRHTLPVLVAVLASVVGVAGSLPGSSGARAGADSPQSTVPLVSLAIVALFVVGVAAVSFLRRPPVRASGPGTSETRVKWPWRGRRRWRDASIVAVLVLVVAVAPVAVGRIFPSPHGTPAQSETQQAPAEEEPAAQPERTVRTRDVRGDRPVVVAVAAMVSVVGAALVVVFVRAVRRRPHPAAPGTDAAVRESVLRAATEGLSELAVPHLDPRSAIIACYDTMERELAAVPVIAPTASDTPTEILARAVTGGIVAREPATRLVRLFSEARFSAHPMTEAHRSEAKSLLRAVLPERGR